MELIWISVLIMSLIFALDGSRRTELEWAHADRNRSFWLLSLLAGGILLVPALVIIPIYLVGVLPRLGSGTPSGRDPFVK